MDWAEKDFREEIEAVKWNWPRETKRKNGQTVGSPRDIVDTGALRNSQRRENESKNSVDFVWTGGGETAYASMVHDGATLTNGTRLPARPFTENTISRLGKIVETEIKREVSSNG